MNTEAVMANHMIFAVADSCFRRSFNAGLVMVFIFSLIFIFFLIIKISGKIVYGCRFTVHG